MLLTLPLRWFMSEVTLYSFLFFWLRLGLCLAHETSVLQSWHPVVQQRFAQKRWNKTQALTCEIKILTLTNIKKSRSRECVENSRALTWICMACTSSFLVLVSTSFILRARLISSVDILPIGSKNYLYDTQCIIKTNIVCFVFFRARKHQFGQMWEGS